MQTDAQIIFACAVPARGRMHFRCAGSIGPDRHRRHPRRADIHDGANPAVQPAGTLKPRRKFRANRGAACKGRSADCESLRFRPQTRRPPGTLRAKQIRPCGPPRDAATRQIRIRRRTETPTALRINAKGKSQQPPAAGRIRPAGNSPSRQWHVYRPLPGGRRVEVAVEPAKQVGH